MDPEAQLNLFSCLPFSAVPAECSTSMSTEGIQTHGNKRLKVEQTIKRAACSGLRTHDHLTRGHKSQLSGIRAYDF